MAKRGAKGRRKNSNESVRAPPPFSDMVDHICEQDKKYFEENPSCSFYLRHYVPGEFWPLKFNGQNWVLVEELHPGLRMRTPCKIKEPDGRKIWEKVGEVGY